MSGICSKHSGYELSCKLCNSHMWGALNITQEEWEVIMRNALAMGLYKCKKCGFKYYKTIDTCPKCYTKRSD